MHEYALAHLSDSNLLRDLARWLKEDHEVTARVIAHLGEVDSRRLYVPAGFSSMFAYCVEELHFSEDAAYKRIRVARAARQFPALFGALADGRLHLAAASLLAPHLTAENAAELIDAASHRSKADVESLLARRFDIAPVRTPSVVIRPIAPLPPGRVAGAIGDLLAGPMSAAAGAVSAGLALCGSQRSASIDAADPQVPLTSSAVESRCEVSNPATSPGTTADQLAAGRVAPASGEERYSVRLTIPKSTYEKLLRAQSLLSHAVPSGDVVQVLDRALDALISRLEMRKVGAASKPSPAVAQPARKCVENISTGNSPERPSPARYIPARVRRAVWERDGGQCTFVTPAGHRCSARRFLEFDHVQPVARGGKAVVEALRLRCRTHNQYSAEQSFGAEFMKHKREMARSERRCDRNVAPPKNQPDRVGERSVISYRTRPGASWASPNRRGPKVDSLGYSPRGECLSACRRSRW